MNAIQDCIVAGEEDAVNQYVPGDLKNKRGVTAYFARDTYLHQRFGAMGWSVTQPFCQRRIISPPGTFGDFPFNIQLLHTRGFIDTNEVAVNQKGLLTEFLIQRNYEQADTSQSLFDDEECGKRIRTVSVTLFL
jgi:hypothetical protein